MTAVSSLREEWFDTGNQNLRRSSVAHHMSALRHELITDVVPAIRSQITALAPELTMSQTLEANIADSVTDLLSHLELAAPDASVEAPQSALALAGLLAERGVPLSALIRAYRMGHGVFLDLAVQRLGAEYRGDVVLVVTDLVTRSNRWVDDVCDQVRAAHEHARVRLQINGGGLRRQWIDELLTGQSVDVERAATALGYRLHGVHLAAVAWPRQDVATRDVPRLFDQASAVLAEQLGAAAPPLLDIHGDREARIWLPFRRSPAMEPNLLRTELERARLPVRIAMGDPADGVDGFGTSYRQASTVRSICLQGRRESLSAVFYREVTPLALMCGDMNAMRRFVAATLGELTLDSERHEELRETLRSFLARNRSYTATARAMTLHRNTVQYRVNQAARKCGGAVESPERAFGVQLALEACHWMPEAMLRRTATLR